MNGVASVEDEPGRHRHRQCCDSADVLSYEWFKLQGDPHTSDAHQHDGQTQGPHVASKQTLKEQENVKMKRTVIIGRVVTVKPVLHHLIDEPAVDALVEVRWLDAQEEEAQERRQRED